MKRILLSASALLLFGCAPAHSRYADITQAANSQMQAAVERYDRGEISKAEAQALIDKAQMDANTQAAIRYRMLRQD